MRVGYPCINRSLECTPNSTFRLKSYSKKRLRETVKDNLSCLMKVLQFNLDHELLFFRIGSGLVPFASHPVCDVDWVAEFKQDFEEVGSFIMENEMRVSMHPDQFVVLNSNRDEVVENSIRELRYHGELLNAMRLDDSAKFMVHVGGVYGDKEAAMNRFCEVYSSLSNKIKRRLVIENDERCYSLKDCLSINERVGVPVVFDTLHHECLNNGESLTEGLRLAGGTWSSKDGLLIVHYSSQRKSERVGRHAESINLSHFRSFLEKIDSIDLDLMLEIKDKEVSALKAVRVLSELGLL